MEARQETKRAIHNFTAVWDIHGLVAAADVM